MPALGQRTPPHIRALDKTLIGEGCWEYGGKIRRDGYGSVYINDGTRSGATALAHRVVYEGLVIPGDTLAEKANNYKDMVKAMLRGLVIEADLRDAREAANVLVREAEQAALDNADNL